MHLLLLRIVNIEPGNKSYLFEQLSQVCITEPNDINFVILFGFS